MSLVPSPPGAPFPPPPLALFNSFLSQNSPAKDGEKQSESSDGSSPMDSEESAEKAEDGAVVATQPQQQQHPMDFPALAMHLLQQAQLGMFGGGGGGSQHGGKPFPPSFSCLPASAPSPPATLPPSSTSKRPSPSHPKSGSSSSASSSGSSSGSRRSGSGRSGSGAPPPPAISAALLAPSPLGALPAIPGALAVAASPAAQLFRDDDWSWHRNPAAAIRSGGTNKQTPVWKYFVYNKTENLSRCIVGTCTYQLKGPHTSTLACHLKKHAAEYAEFQRLKAEYTRERVISGQQSAGDSNPNMASLGGSSSSCSTPSSQSNGGGGVLTVRENPTKSEETRRSPQEGRTNIMGPNHHHPFSSCTPSPGPGFGRADNGMVEQHPEYQHPPHLNHFQQFAPPATLSHHHPLNVSIFGPLHPHHPLNGFCSPHPPPAPPQFHHLMMAAAMAAANGTNGTRPGSAAPPPEKVAVLCPEEAAGRAEEGKVPKGRKREKPTGGSGSGGTGANLLDILNLLSKRAAAAAAEKEEREQEEEVEEEEGDEKKRMGRRKKKRKMMKTEEGPDDEGRAHRLTHSVEHLLLKEEEEGGEGGEGQMKKAKMEKTDEDDEEEEEMRWDGEDDEAEDKEEDKDQIDGSMGNDEEDEKHSDVKVEDEMTVPDDDEREEEKDEREDDHPLSSRDTLALSLATSFSRPALRRLLEDNPFFRHFRFPSSIGDGEEGLSLEQVEEVLSSQWALLRRRLSARLARGPFALLALVRCTRCRLIPARCICPSSRSLFCSLAALVPRGDHPSPILLAMRPFQGGDQTDRQMESLVEQVLAEFGPSSSSTCSAPLHPCFIIIQPPPSSSSSIPSLPTFLSNSLQNSVHQMLREDAEQIRMRNKFWGMIRAMMDSEAGAEFKTVTGIAMPSGDLLSASDVDDDDIDAFFKFAPPILEKHSELRKIWEAKADGPREEANMAEWEWQSLRESAQLFEFCDNFEQQQYQMTEETANTIVGHWEHTLGTIRENFPALGELTKSLATDLANKTGTAIEMAKGAVNWEPMIFPRGMIAGGENEDEEESIAEWAERSALLLANWRPKMS